MRWKPKRLDPIVAERNNFIDIEDMEVMQVRTS